MKELISRGVQVTALVHERISPFIESQHRDGRLSVVTADITDRTDLFRALRSVESRIPVSSIVHCAAHVSDIGPDKLFRRSNYESVKHLCDHILETKECRLVFISTTDVYGLKDFSAADETTPLCNNMRNPYPGYKILAEKHITETLPGNRYSILRPAMVWGPGDETILPRVLDFFKRSPFVVHFGRWKGENRWPLAHVNNLAVAAYLASFTDGFSGKAVNIVDPDHITMEDYYRKILEVFLPSKANMKSINIPFFAGWIAGWFSTTISNILRKRSPIFDPSLYGLYFVSRNLDFSSREMVRLFEEYGERAVFVTEGFKELVKALCVDGAI